MSVGVGGVRNIDSAVLRPGAGKQNLKYSTRSPMMQDTVDAPRYFGHQISSFWPLGLDRDLTSNLCIYLSRGFPEKEL